MKLICLFFVSKVDFILKLLLWNSFIQLLYLRLVTQGTDLCIFLKILVPRFYPSEIYRGTDALDFAFVFCPLPCDASYLRNIQNLFFDKSIICNPYASMKISSYMRKKSKVERSVYQFSLFFIFLAVL